MCCTRLGETGIDLLLTGDVDFAEDPADVAGERFALCFVEVEQRDPNAPGGQATSGGGAQSGSAAGDDCAKACIEFHGFLLLC